MMRRSTTALALLAASVGCGPAQAPVESPTSSTDVVHATSDGTALADVAGRPLLPAEERAFAPMLETAQRVRGLRFVRPVPTRVQSQAQIVDFVRSRIDREELAQTRLFYVALGLLPASLDVEAMLLDVMGEQIVGYYDPKVDGGVMVLRDDVVARLRSGVDLGTDQSALSIVHEYVHALQDQHLGLGDLAELERSVDGENAFAALVEGDATLAMLGWVVERQGQRLSMLTRNPALLRRLLGGAPRAAGGEALDAAPPIVRVPLLSRYLDGLVFAATLHGQGGFRWLDEAFATPPTSTEQILHPERWLARERPEAVALPHWDELAAAGLTALDEDTLGELETSVYLALGTDQDRDVEAGTGWGGDRLRVYTRADRTTAAVWFTTWDDETEAEQAEAAALRVQTHPDGAAAGDRVLRTGRAVLILRNLEPELHAPVLASFETFAASLPPRPRGLLD